MIPIKEYKQLSPIQKEKCMLKHLKMINNTIESLSLHNYNYDKDITETIASLEQLFKEYKKMLKYYK